jgi:putative endonuclease
MTGFGRFAVYLLASRKYGPLYTGVTGNLINRVVIHREELLKGFTSRYHIHNLVYFELYDDPSDAILREKRIKKWRREWKIALIEKDNPEWADLFDSIIS